MVYSDKDLKKALKDKTFSFKEPISQSQIEPASIDLKLSNIIKIFNSLECSAIDVKKKDSLQKMMQTIKIDTKKGFVLHPGKFVLTSTKEYIKLSNKVLARVEGKSSLARLGLLVHTAGFVDPGFEGTLTLEISNQSEISIILYPDMYICQIAIEELSSPCEKSYSQRKKSLYSNSNGPKEANISNLFKKITK